MLALKFAVKFGKLDLYTRNSFVSTPITSQTYKSQGKHESYWMVSNDRNLDHSHLLYPTPRLHTEVVPTSFPSEHPADGPRFTPQSVLSAGTFLTKLIS